MKNHWDFLGREKQLKEIRKYVEKSNHRYLISIQGRGGVGKTYLLRKIGDEYAGQEEFLCFPIVDFSQNKTRTEDWLMDFVAGHAPGAFDQYYKISQTLLGQGQVDLVGVFSQTDLREVFLADFMQLEQKIRCIFLLDTLELIQDTLLLDFLLKLVNRAQNSIFVLAGRRNFELEDRFQGTVGPGSVVFITLAGFDELDAMHYIQRHPVGADLNEDEKYALYLLAEEGVPIKLALALDWLSRGLVMHTLVEHPVDELRKLKDQDKEAFGKIVTEFERELVTQIGELGTHVDQAIHIMAHVHKRFNKALLQRLIPDANADKLLEQLRLIPFVKSIEEDYFVLHDEIQRMIVKHIWDWSDSGHEVRQKISEEVLMYYDHKLTSLRSQFPVDSEMSQTAEWEYRIYEIEKLHYQLDIDLIEGYAQFSNLFKELEDRRYIEFAALAMDTLVKDRPLPARLRDFVNTYYRGWVLIRRQQVEQAREHIEQGLERLTSTPLSDDPLLERRQFLEREVEQRLGEVYTLLGYCYRLLGDWAMAVCYFEKARELNKALIDKLQQVEAPDRELIRRSISRLAETLNDIANLQRMQGNLDIARRYCKMSMLIREGLDERRRVGHCCYVMGMIMWESGNTSEAMNYLEQARGHYQATRTELLERAWLDRYEGYVMFRTGNTQEALRLLERALDTTSKNQDLQDEHAEILLHLSRIHYELGTPESRQQALREVETALVIANQVGNDYRIVECYLTLCRILMPMLNSKKDRDGKLRAQFDKHFETGLKLAQRHKYRRLEVVFAQIEADLAFARKDYMTAFERYIVACQRATEFKPAVFARTLSTLSERLYEVANIDADQAISLSDRVIRQWVKEISLDDQYPELRQEVNYIREMAQSISRRHALDRDFENELRHGSWQKALLICDEAEDISLYNHPNQATIFHHRAEVYHGVNDFSLARLYCERAIRIRMAYGADPKVLADSHILLSRIYWKLGNTAESANYLDQAEEQYKKGDSPAGLGLVELERAIIFFRTRQFSRANENLAKAQEIFKKINEPVLLASTLNVMSRVARVDPRRGEYEEISYEEALRRGEEALQVLGDRNWFVAAEINLTLCILHYIWGRKLLRLGNQEEAEKHFALTRKYNYQGWDKIELIDSPMLYSVYRGMQANLFLQVGENKKAKLHFLDELVYATQTKHMRLLRALDLLENWLISEPLQTTQEYCNWFINAWREKGLSQKYPEVEEAMHWLIAHRPYILEEI